MTEGFSDSELASRLRQSLARFVSIRQDIHANPELSGAEVRTSRIVGDLLEDWGFEVARNIGGHGVVASLHRGTSTKSVGLRADMDALPIHETTNLPYASRASGVMHACGHDGHTASLLCAAHDLIRHGHFDGTLRLVFQPAEENGTGACAMLADGLLSRFPVQSMFGMHNLPGLELGKLGMIWGPALASSDTGRVTIRGKGGHGAYPHMAVDPIVAGATMVVAVQTIVSRNLPPSETGVVTIGAFNGGTSGSIIPESVELQFTIRAFTSEIRALLKSRFVAMVEAQAAVHGATASVEFLRSVAPTLNNKEVTDFAELVAVETFGRGRVRTLAPFTGGEDFSYFSQAVPASFVHIGNGDSAELHSSHYDYSDDLILPSAAYWVRLAESYLS